MEKQEDELYDFLQGIDLLQYYEVFRREGFERLESIADIQETDFEALGVKRGHRRFIQRKALELVNPLQYSRELPPIGSPLLAVHHTHQSSAEPTPSSSLEKREPLTAYLYRQHAHQQPQQQSQSQSQQQQQQQQQGQMVVQTQAASAQPHTYYPQHPYYHHHYSSQSKQQPHQLPSQQQSQQSQQSQSLPQPRRSQMQSTVGYPHVPRISVPFPKAGSDAAARSTPTSPEYPSSTVGGMVRSPGALASQQPIQGAATHLSEKTGIMISPGQGASSQTQQMAMHASSYSQKSVSASTEDPSPQRTRAPDSPFSGTYQHTQPISNVMRSPTIRQRQRGQSMSSVSSSRRRDSRSEHKLPYSRPVGETQSPKSPQAQIPSALAQSPRRTYRRHPKKDPNAPEKWRSAYQLFRDDVNRELHGQDIPFSEMSKIHSKRWTDLSDEKRTVYFERSRQDKEDYAAKMAVYEKTPEFRQYSEYLDKFYKQESTVNRVGRPKGTKSSKAKGKGPDRGVSEEYDYENSPSIGAAKPSMSASSSPPPSLSSLDRSPG